MLPLQGLKVLDFTTLLPGPFASMYLADWGAEVLRIEAPDREDLSRLTPPFVAGTSTTHAFLGRNKSSLVLDLKTPTDLTKVHQLLGEYDVLLEGFRPGVMGRYGLDYASLKKQQPKLIYVSITGYGQVGPYRDRAGHDINYAALSGLAAMTGSKTSGPALHGTPVCDLAGSMHALIGLLMAVIHRQKTGEGQYLDCSITDSSLMLSGLWAQMSLAAATHPTYESTLLNGGSYYGYYRTKDDRFISVGGLEPKFIAAFLARIDRPQLPVADPRRQAEVKAAIASRIAEKTLGEWQEIFGDDDLCVEPVLTMEEVVQHPSMRERGMVVQVPAVDGKSQPQLASPLRFSTLRPHYRHIGLPKGQSRPQG